MHDTPALPRRRTVPVRAAIARWQAAALALGVGAGLAGGCNLVTGADDVEIGAGGTGASASGGSGTGLVATGGGATTTTSSGGGTGTGTGSGTTTSGTGATGGGLPTGGSGGTPPPPDCTTPCGAHQYCDIPNDTCLCDPGFVAQGSDCAPIAPGDPASHSQAEVCQRWTSGHAITTPDALVSNGHECDAGYLRQGALNDTLARLNMFRWLVGLGPAGDDLGANEGAQQCAVLEAWFTWPPGVSPHSPPESSSQCWNQTGASVAGASNLAWGSGHPASAIDQFIVDSGNLDTMGHRRWIFNPPLDPVGIGYWNGGGQYGDGMCLGVFSGGGAGPFPAWTALPNPGFTPIEVTSWPWTFQGNDGAIADATISVLRVDDNTPLAVTVHDLWQGYGQTAIAWTLDGWSTQAGMTYRVTVAGLSGGDVVYDVKPVSCN